MIWLKKKFAENLPSFYNVLILCQAVKQSTLSCWLCHCKCSGIFSVSTTVSDWLPGALSTRSLASSLLTGIVTISSSSKIHHERHHHHKNHDGVALLMTHHPERNLYLQSWPCSVSDLEEDLRAASAFLSTKRSSSVFTDSLDDLSSRLMMILLMMYIYKIFLFL